MGEAIVLSWETHSAHLLEGLWHQFLSNYNTDFEIVLKNDDGVATTSVKAHHLVLSVFCPNLDSTQKTMNLEEKLDISKEDIQCLMEFIYSGTIKVTGDRLKQLKDGANAIGLTIMVEMIDNINSNKLLEVCPEEHESTGVVDPQVQPPKRKRKMCTTGAGIEVMQKRPRRQTTSNEVPIVIASDTYQSVKSDTVDSSCGHTSDQIKQKKLGKRPYRKLLSKEPIIQDKDTEETSANDGEFSQPSNVDENVVEPKRQRTATKKSSQNSNDEKKPQQIGRRKRQKKMLLEIDPEEAEQSKQINDEQSKEDNGSSSGDPINDQCLKEDAEETYDMSSPEGRSYWMKQMIIKVTNQRRKHWTCDLCGQSRDGWYRQLSHIRCHMNPDQLLKCPHCDFVAEMTFDLNRHLAAKHSVENPLDKMKCPNCEFICDKKAQLEAHQKAEHPNQFVCDECTDAFPTRHKLMSHKLVKHGRRRRANPRHVLPKPTMATLLILT